MAVIFRLFKSFSIFFLAGLLSHSGAAWAFEDCLNKNVLTSDDQLLPDDSVVTVAGLDSSARVAVDPPNRRAERIHCDRQHQTNLIGQPSELRLKTSNKSVLLKSHLPSGLASVRETGSIWLRVRNCSPPFSLFESSSRYLLLSVLTI